MDFNQALKSLLGYICEDEYKWAPERVERAVDNLSKLYAKHLESTEKKGQKL
jgi:hypothetical protein